ncbi:MAG: cysteine hydrolase family protein [Alkalibacterium sp.]|uniref:cysteine hydrolase family protein n=1 Tax=Alkalibacterium sp. TaxID=1872447 RepID=UPI003970B061
MATADALIIIDMQNGVCHYEDQTIGNLDYLIERINERITDYALEEKPIIFIQHTDDYLEKGTQKWEIIPELNRSHSEYFIEKSHPNSFYHTDLKEVLEKLDAQKIEICGVETQYCVDSTVKFAHGLGYTIQMQKETHSAWDNAWMTGDQTVRFYEEIWHDSFVTFI